MNRDWEKHADVFNYLFSIYSREDMFKLSCLVDSYDNIITVDPYPLEVKFSDFILSNNLVHKPIEDIMALWKLNNE